MVATTFELDKASKPQAVAGATVPLAISVSCVHCVERMATFAMSLAAIARSQSSARSQRVLLMADGLKVGDVAATLGLAKVVKFLPLRHRANQEFVGHNMRLCRAKPAIDSLVPRAIACRSNCTSPSPTILSRLLGQVTPEPLGVSCSAITGTAGFRAMLYLRVLTTYFHVFSLQRAVQW